MVRPIIHEFTPADVRNHYASLEARVLSAFLQLCHSFGYHGVPASVYEILDELVPGGNPIGEAVLTHDPPKGPFYDAELEGLIAALQRSLQHQGADRMSGAEFRAFQASRPDHERWELVGGVAVPVVRRSIMHNRLASNLDRLLNERLERYAPSLLTTQRLGIDFDARDCKPEPDVAAVDADYGAGHRFVEKAYLLAEVASEAEEIVVPGADRRWIDVKREMYRGHPHCEAVVVGAQDRTRVELDLRIEAGWKSCVLEGPDAELVVPSMGARCFLGDLYEGTPLRPCRGERSL